MTPLTLRLDDAWKQAVVADQVINQFEAVQADPGDRWTKGDRITYGVKFVEGQFVYYARNLDQNCDIQGKIEQKFEETGYLCRLNSYRALRPGAGNRPVGRQLDIPAEAALCRFHCQDSEHPISLLRRKPLLTVPLTHFIWNAYHNVAPIEATGHFLWIPATTEGAIPHMLQQLTPELIEDAVQLFDQLSDTILFFNALHAGASVNHIHFQAIRHWHQLPAECASVVDYKGYHLLDNYPAQAAVFDLKQPISALIGYVEKLQQLDFPFNLVMLSGRALVVARDGDQAVVPEFPGDRLAALEMCGAIATVDRTAFDTITPAMIKTVLRKAVVPASTIIDRFSEYTPI